MIERDMGQADELLVVGHENVLQQLRQIETSSLLFVGPDGVGRRRVARWHAARLNCLNSEADPCGRCDSCRRFMTGHPDFREITANTTTATGRRSRRPEITIGQLVPRKGSDDPLSRWLEQRPAFSRRVGVVDGADRMTLAAANSFLKMLEEPPSYSTIILIAPSSRAVLPTVASRCSVLRFGAVDTTAMGTPEHPAHHLGRPGPLLQPEPEWEAAKAEVDRFVGALDGTLEEALAAADAIAARWQGTSGLDPVDLLRERLKGLPPATRARADDFLLACEEAIGGYSPAVLATRVLVLELRALLARSD